jgi:hypothetical protein
VEANVRDEGAWFVCAVPARRAAGNQIGEVATEFAEDSSGAAAWIETDKGDFGSVKLILPQMLLDPLEEQFHLPTHLVELANS